MNTNNTQQIRLLLSRFLDGQTTLDEERQLADYFRSTDVPAEWADYREMFAYFDRGMSTSPTSEAHSQPLSKGGESQGVGRRRSTPPLGRGWGWAFLGRPRTLIAAAVALALIVTAVAQFNRHAAPTAQTPPLAQAATTEKAATTPSSVVGDLKSPAHEKAATTPNRLSPQQPTPSRLSPLPLPCREGSNFSLHCENQEVGLSTPLPTREGQGGESVGGGLQRGESEPLAGESPYSLTHSIAVLCRAEMQSLGYEAYLTEDGDIVYVSTTQTKDISI